jgi:hypothetical protein
VALQHRQQLPDAFGFIKRAALGRVGYGNERLAPAIEKPPPQLFRVGGFLRDGRSIRQPGGFVDVEGRQRAP